MFFWNDNCLWYLMINSKPLQSFSLNTRLCVKKKSYRITASWSTTLLIFLIATASLLNQHQIKQRSRVQSDSCLSADLLFKGLRGLAETQGRQWSQWCSSFCCTQWKSGSDTIKKHQGKPVSLANWKTDAWIFKVHQSRNSCEWCIAFDCAAIEI